MDIILKYKLLSFITLCKKQRRNSVCLYRNESISKRVKDLGIGYNNFKKYKQICLDNNLLKVTSKGNLVFIKMKDIMTFMNDGVVNEKNLTFNRFVLFFNYTTYEKLTFKNIYNQIRKSIVLKNYSQQQYKIDITQDLIKTYYNKDYRNTKAPKANYRTFKRISKKAAEVSMSSNDYMKSLSLKNRDYIVSGKHHISRLIGMSSSTGQRILKELSKKEIKREVIKETLSTILSRDIYDSYVDMYKNTTYMVVPSQDKVYLIKGSKITLNDNTTKKP